jgi:hypothetical protein
VAKFYDRLTFSAKKTQISQKRLALFWSASAFRQFNRRGTFMFTRSGKDDAKNNVWVLLFP